MSADINEFLAKEPRFRCVPLSASLTLAQCKRNRQRTGDELIFSCQSCAGLGKAVELAERTESRPLPKKGEVARCAGCGRSMRIVCKGMCSRCYQKNYRLGAAFLPASAAPSVLVVFSQPADRAIYEALAAESEDLASDILAVLHLYLAERSAA